MSESIAGKKVLVTGADGFIGSHLIELLVARGARPTALVYYNSWNEKGWLRDVPPAVLRQVELLPGDNVSFHLAFAPAPGADKLTLRAIRIPGLPSGHRQFGSGGI